KIVPMPEFSDLYRRAVLATADASWVKGFVGRHGFKLGVGRFIAGRDVNEALPKLKAIEASGKGVIIDVLREVVATEEAARGSAERISAVIRAVHAAGVQPYFSVKPTQLGLGVSPDLALELAEGLAEQVGSVDGTMCFDMESSGYVDG